MGDVVERFFRKRDCESIRTMFQDLAIWFLKRERISEAIAANRILTEIETLKESGPCSEEEYIEELKSKVLPYSTNTGHPHFIGHMTSLLPNFMRPLSELVTALNQNMVKVETARAATRYERQAIAFMHREVYGRSPEFYRDSIGAPDCVLGLVTSGGTIANLTALQCARHVSLQAIGDVEKLGIHEVLRAGGYEKSVILCSRLGHYSLKKSAGLLGLGRENLIEIPLGSNRQVRAGDIVNELQRCARNRIHVCAIVGVAGATECGTYDPLEEMAKIAAAHDVHFHVDAAWGGAVVFSKKHRFLVRGIEKADSVTIDGHKQLYSPMGIGMALFKNPPALRGLANEASYIIRKNSYDLGRYSIEGSRPANIFYLQAGLKLLGRDGYGELVDKSIRTAKRMAMAIEEFDDFQLLTRPKANIFLYRYSPRVEVGKELTDKQIDQINVRIHRIQSIEGRCFVSRTLFRDSKSNRSDVVALRVVIANPLTEVEHCLEVLEDQRRIASE